MSLKNLLWFTNKVAVTKYLCFVTIHFSVTARLLFHDLNSEGLVSLVVQQLFLSLPHLARISQPCF